jgi:hypothetical protein
MTRRLFLAWLFIGFILAGSPHLRAQHAVGPVAVNESRARAVLASPSIRLELPFVAPTITGGKAVAWTLSPTGTASPETSATFQAGVRLVSLTLPWPRDEKGKSDDVGWYRIAYRIETANAPSLNGILSIGAIAPELLTLRLALPENLVPGKPLSVRVYAGNPVTRRGFRGVRLEGTLQYDGEPTKGTKPFSRTVVRAAVTGSSGEAVLVYPVQGEPGDTATLTVRGVLTGQDGAQAKSSIDADVEIRDRTAIHIDTDKPLHKPGEVVHLRALVFGSAGRAVVNSALTLTIKDPDSKTLLEVPLTTNRFGIASYDWKTGSQLAPGDYGANFDLDESSDSTGSMSASVAIRRYDLPEFAVSASMDRGFYLDGQTPVVRLHAGYLFGKPVSAGAVRIVRAEKYQWNRTAKKIDPEKAEQTATLDEHGDAELKLNVQDDFSDFKTTDYERYRDIEYRAYVTDASTGRTEPRNFTARLTHYAVHIYLNQMGGNNREGDYIVSTAYADGTPTTCKVTLDWMDADSRPSRATSVSTNRYGLARVHLRYPSPPNDDERPSFNLRLTVRDVEQRKSVFDETLNVEDPNGTWISVAASLMKPGQNIEATVHGTPGRVIDVDALSEQGVISHQQIHMLHAAEPITMLMGDQFRGYVTLIAYSMDRESEHYSWRGWSAYKTVLYPEDRELKVKLSGLRTSYLPGSSVDVGLDVRTAGAFAAPGAVGVAVIDTAVEQRAATEEDANQRWFGGNWWRDSSNIAGITYEDLAKTDMSQPVSDDLQLVAEAGFQYNIPLELKLESEDHNDVRNDLLALMQKQLKPVGDAILAAHPARLPGTPGDVHTIANAAALDPTLLLDPWDTPYRVKAAVEWSDEVLRMVSAGPDKRFGTEDDFTIDVMRRNVFARPGARLTKLLHDAVAAGKTLPANVDGLKQLAWTGGLDLDETFDPDGQPYLYEIEVGRRFYNVHVFRHDAQTQENGRFEGTPAWSSTSIDYFSHTEAQMEAAIDKWTAAGKLFPATEGEARQAFAAAGIDVDGLRDPLGQGFQLRTSQVMSYTRVENVTAGTSLEATNKPVTRLYRAIQIFRPTKLAEDPTALEMVAQFLHPISEQSGRDMKPQVIEGGTFKGNTGAIGGTVSDPTGAVIPNATVTIKTGAGVTVATVKSGVNGIYVAPDLDPGIYTVQVAVPGFMDFVVTEVRVSPMALTTVDVELRIGATNETVTVTSAAPELSTSNASLGVAAGFSRTASSASGKATISEPTFTPRLRHVFEETAFWAPSIETAPNGRAALHFNLPDSLTTWKLHALASTVDGRIGELDQTFKTFQPFFVDLDMPQMLTVGDEISLPVNLRNYTDHGVSLPVIVKPADWLTLLTTPRMEATVPANGSTPLVFGFRATAASEAGPFRITAASAHEGDAVEKTVRIHPDGEPRSLTTSGLLTQGSTTLALDLPADTIPGSIHAELLLYPNLGAHVLHAMKAVLERPYGCGEQTISSTYPSLLYLKLLKASRADSDAVDPVSIEAQTYLQLGYDRLADYFDASGGLTYWGGRDHDPDPALTAYGIEFLTEATPYITVDHDHILTAINWLLAAQQADGSWKPRYGSTTADLNLYIAKALGEALASDALTKDFSKPLRDRANHAVAAATAWSAHSAAAVHAPYANALRLSLAELPSGDSAAATRLRTELASTAVRSKDGAHWNPLGYSPFYGWGHAGELETTALALSALRQGLPSPAEAKLINDALLYVLRNQDRYGIWYSGQATVRVLQALLPLAIEQMKAGPSPQPFQLTVNGAPLTGGQAEALHTDPRLLAAPRSLDLTAMLKPGHNDLVFVSASNASLASTEATASFYVPWQGDAALSKTQTGTDSGLDFGYSCTATNAQVGKPINCTVNARRFGSPSYGMLLAEVGLPPGAEVDRSSLTKLLDDWTISRYELQPDRIVFYLWSPLAAGSHFAFRFTPRYTINAKAAPATLSDYYNPDLKVVLAPQVFSVTSPSQK